ncbi:Exopolysaccharide biosynthesis protein YbjH [Gammaproteobacteria bacterium]
MQRHRSLACAALFLCCTTPVVAAPPNPAASITGQTGIINMPDARVDEDGSWRIGISNSSPYGAIWSSLTILPWLELSGRFTRMQGVPTNLGAAYGNNKDKAFDLKLIVLPESLYLPQVAVGAQDFFGTRLFAAEYLTVSRNYGALDLTAGYGMERIRGAFYGARYALPWNNLSLVAESDAYNYAHDPHGKQSGAIRRPGGLGYGVEYRSRLAGLQLSHQSNTWGVNAYVSLPLMEKEFIPKTSEPPPYTTQQKQVSVEEWISSPTYRKTLLTALHDQEFGQVRLHIEDKTLQVSLTNDRISLIGRAVGRAARTIILTGPKDLERLEITYKINDMPALSYQFRSITALQRYFAGKIGITSLMNSVSIFYSSPEYAKRFAVEATPELGKPLMDVNNTSLLTLDQRKETDATRKNKTIESIKRNKILHEDRDEDFTGDFTLSSIKLDTYLNDPSGFFHYNIYTQGNYYYHINDGLFFESSARITLAEDVSKVKQKSNSRLPHVRSNLAEYMKSGPVRLRTLMLNKYVQLRKEVYSRTTFGYYEDMFAGTGGQVLYYPQDRNWAVDLSLDAVRLRAPLSQFGFSNYSTVTSIGSFHYRFPRYGITTAIRAGRFLARDRGVNFDIARRFRSGVTIGVWYTKTNGKDTTNPGTPAHPYQDKGVFFSIPLAAFLSHDSQERGSYALSPWSRDVGQMVDAPDLYGIVEDVFPKQPFGAFSGLGN